MISASLYIVTCSAKNRVRRRVARLREPRYLVGAIVGAAYIYFSFFARARGQRAAAARRRNAPPGADAASAALVAAGPALVSMGFLMLATIAWVLPFDSGLLEFSEAETNLLFPAPVTRRQLLLHRLMRSQGGILFGSIIVAIASPVGGWMRFRLSIATWLLFVTMRVYFTAVTLSRNAGRTGAARTVAWLPFGAFIAATGVVMTALVRAWRMMPVQNLPDALSGVGDVALHGVSSVVLWPFLALARPLFAPTLTSFAVDVGAAFVVLGITIAWMLRRDEAFQESAAVASARRAEKAQARRGTSVRARATGLSLSLTGRPEPAFFWKNGVQTLRLAGISAIRIGMAVLGVCGAAVSVAVNTFHLRGAAAAGCAVAMAVATFTAILGPQIVRTDLRSDLVHLELLKTWPVRAGAVIRGEMAWPALMLTAIGWMAIALAAALSPAAFPRIAPATRMTIAASMALLMPAFVFVQYLVQNAAALAFPAWVPQGNQRPRGVDAIGQRLIMLTGVLLLAAVLMIPGAVGGGAIFLALSRWTGVVGVVPAALVCTAIVLLEVLVGSELLGPLYERLDILAVERTE